MIKRLAERAPWIFPALVALVAFGPAAWALYSQTFAILGRDQGIFQYVAWALRHGDKVYKDLHEINGPLPHAYFSLQQIFGGEDEHVFRVHDTFLLVTVYVLGSLTLPRWVGGDARTKWLWAAAGVGVLGAQYARYDWWHTAQREALYAVLVFGSLALQSIGHTAKSEKAALRAFALAGVLTALPWFGKPPCAIFTVLQVAVAFYDRASLPVSLKKAGGAAFMGFSIVGLSMLVFVLACEDLFRGIAFLAKVPQLHHTIWNETLLGSYKAYHNGPTLNWAMVSFAAFIVAYRVFRLPRRALLAGVLPLGGFLVFIGQGKAFPYHMHMLTLGTGVAQLVVVCAFSNWLQSANVGKPSFPWLAPAGAVLALLLGFKSAQDAWLSPAVVGKWASIGGTAAKRATREYVNHFPFGDFFPNDLRDAAAYVAFKTRPDETVQIYGFDPYFLFLARRKSASPIMYGFELNVDAALEGGPGSRPSPELRQWLLDYRNEAEDIVLASVELTPPAAFALFDRAPFTHPPDADKDFEEHCPKLFGFLSAHYVRAATFGTVRLWLRKDVLAR